MANPSSICAPAVVNLTTPYPTVGFVTPEMFSAPGQNVSNGTTDATSAIQAAATAAGIIGASLYIPGTENFYLVSGSINIPSNVTVYGDGSASYIKCSNLAVSILTASSAVQIVFRDIKVGYATGSSGTADIGGISLSNTTNCTVERVEFDHMIWSGVYVSGSGAVNNLITNIYVHDTQGTAGDTNDIAFTDNASYNTVQFSRLFGGLGAANGVLIQDRAGGTAPIGNQILYNNIADHNTYGVLAGYQPTPTNLYTKVIGNTIQNISGTGNAGSSGMGIYAASVGGLIIAFNRITNTCYSTTDATNLPAAISLTSQPGFTTAIVSEIQGNIIATSAWGGIAAANLPLNITGNNVSNSDISANGSGLKVIDPTSGSVFANNTAVLPSASTRQAIFIETSTVTSSGLSVTGNTAISGGGAAAFDIVGTDSHGITGTFSGNVGNSVGTSGQGIRLQNVSGLFTGNSATGASVGLFLNNVTNLRGACNSGRSASSTITVQGTNSNSAFDQTNDFDIFTSAALINNTSAGVKLEMLYTHAPSGGVWQIGDTIVSSTPSIGNPYLWINTTAGSPGTFTAGANL